MIGISKIEKKYCHLNNFVKKVVTQEETKTNNEKVNVGYLSNKQLKDKLDNIETKFVPNAKKKKNRNGKVGINKHNNNLLLTCMLLEKYAINVVV